MAMYSKNTCTMLLKTRKLKARIHWILQVIGSVFIVFGIGVQIYNKLKSGENHFQTKHSITGEIEISGGLLFKTLIFSFFC